MSRLSAIVATAICRPAYFPAESGRSPWRGLCGLACLAVLGAWPMVSSAERLQLDLGRLDHPAFSLEGVTADIGAEGDAADFTVDRIAVGDYAWTNVRLRCSTFALTDGQIGCRGGTLAVPAWPGGYRIELNFDSRRGSGDIRVHGEAEESIAISLSPSGGIDAVVAALSLARLHAPFPVLGEWQADGRFDGRVTYRPASRKVSLTGRLTQTSFASADGLHAGESLAFDVEVAARPDRGGWSWGGHVSWREGAAYLHPVYLTAGARLAATGHLGAERLSVDHASLEVEGVRAIEASGEVSLGDLGLTRAALVVAEADLAVIGPRFIAPVIAPARADSLLFEGSLSAGIRMEHGEPVAADIALTDVSFALQEGDLGFGPVSGAIPWERDGVTQAWLAVGGGYWEKLQLGAFELDARLTGRSVDVAHVAIPILDGRLVLRDLALNREHSGWSGGGSAVIEPISMRLLTDAVGLPPMSGVMSASMPGLRVTPGEVALDGALVISVFDGYVQATSLHAIEPLGVASRISVDIEARNIDLAQLTETFSFGSVTGFMDADVLGLELVNWRPTAFEAAMRSSPGRYPRRISQRAVQNIGALGGAGAAIAIQRGFLGFFESFGYREVGLSCTLSGGVCLMDGIERGPGDGFVIVRGGGVPALNVIGYNRRVDWNELLDRLQRVIESNMAPVIQ